MELAFNQDIQEKLREEILEKAKQSDGKMSYESLQEMTFLNQIINGILYFLINPKIKANLFS